MENLKFELVSPFPEKYYHLLHDWTFEYPERVRDDSWPKDLGSLRDMMNARAASELTVCVMQEGVPVGFIGYANIDHHKGTLRGVCFTKSVHGNGVPFRALRMVLQQQFDSGIHKIYAFPFADNARAIGFYYKLGAKFEGHLRENTTRDGVLTDMLLLAFFAKHDTYPCLTDGFPGFIQDDKVRTDG